MTEIEKLRKVAEAARALIRRDDFWVPVKRGEVRWLPGEFDTLVDLLAAPVEPAPTAPEVYRLGHTVGAEWMREQAAGVADRNDLSAWGIAREIRSLPVSPPAPEEAHTPQIPCSVHGLPLHLVYRCDKCPDGGAQKQDGGSA